jgi:hypothetical protein
MLVALVDGQRSQPKPGFRGACPGCGGEVVAKCGEKVVWHWAHRVAECNYLSEPETEWHLDWKSRFPIECQEVSIENHRADVKGPLAVLEVQHSSISLTAIREREEFYGEMLWVLDAVRFGGTGFADDIAISYEGKGRYFYRWKRKGPKRSFADATKPIILDLPGGLFQLSHSTRHQAAVGRYLTSQELYTMVCGDDVPVVPHEWHERDRVLSEARKRREHVFDEMTRLRRQWTKAPDEYRRRFWWASEFSNPPTWLVSSSGVDRFIDEEFIEHADVEFEAAEKAIADLKVFAEKERIRELRKQAEWERKEQERLKHERSLREAAEAERIRLEIKQRAEEEQRQRELEEARKISEEEFQKRMAEYRRRNEELRKEREEIDRREREEWAKELALRERLQVERQQEEKRRIEQAKQEFAERARAQLLAWKHAEPGLHYYTLALMWQVETGQELTGARVKEVLNRQGSAAHRLPT